MERYHYTDTEQALIERSRVPFAVYQFINSRTVTVALSQGFCDLFGYEDMAQAYHDMNNDMYKNTFAEDAARVADAAVRFASGDENYDILYRTKKDNSNEHRLIHAKGEHIYTETGVRLAQVWYTDEGAYNQKEGRVFDQIMNNALSGIDPSGQSYYDNLTGLPGMTRFFELATLKRDDIYASGGKAALMYMDFSGMKYYNHKYGFAEGDKLLREFSRLISRYFGNDNCSRLGQDHFAVIAENNGLEELLSQLFDECASINGGVSLNLHVGIYDQWYDSAVASMALDRAKFACDMLRNTYASAFSYYNMSMKDTEEKQQYIIANIDRAIAERWIKVYYQPIVRTVNGRVCDEEALARWIDPIKGFMSPGEFIPVLEEHKLIYKLDLYVVDCVLIKLKTFEEAGLTLMPQSINLSRSDFDTCDIVEEIRRRVDAAGIPHDLITIEITESVIGQEFEFMKSQIDRFRENGFAVWMDDFGSGYSSLDVLQTVNFDLIKFDMKFLQNLNANSKCKIMLAELMKMCTMLGVATICEGVETAEQVQFLQETGCTKLQGYYFDKPIPVEKILDKYAKGIQIGFEDPDESMYFDSVGRVNLHDLSIIAQGDTNDFSNFFNTLPMAIIEINQDRETLRFTRTNQSYKTFMERTFNFITNDKTESYAGFAEADKSPFLQAIKQCVNDSNINYVYESFPGGIVVNSCVRRIAVNPKNGTVAIAVAVLSITDSAQGTTYANIAKALAADYSHLYYVNTDDDRFIEYSSSEGGEELDIERHGEDFFAESRKDALDFIHHEDHERFFSAFTKENIIHELEENGLFTLTYRLLVDGEPVYVLMKIMRMQHDLSHIIIGVSNIDAYMKQKLMLENIKRNEIIYSRIMALYGDYICMYVVDPETEDYFEYIAADDYKGLGLAKEGKKFFDQSHHDSESAIFPEDRTKFRENFVKEKVLDKIKRNKVYSLQYRLIINKTPVPVIIRAALVQEGDRQELIFGVSRQNSEQSGS